MTEYILGQFVESPDLILILLRLVAASHQGGTTGSGDIQHGRIVSQRTSNKYVHN